MFDNNKDHLEMYSIGEIKNEIEFNITKEVLRDNNIPFLTKEEGAGNYLRIIGGFSLFPYEIFVSKNDFNRANEILNSIFIDRNYKSTD